MSSFKNRLLLSYIVYGIALLLVAMYAVESINESGKKEHYKEHSIQKLTEQKNIFEQYTKSIEKKLFTIRDSKIFKQYLSNGIESDSNVIDMFSYIASTSTEIMQLRYLDENGLEKIRIDRAECASTPVLIPNNKLQNKSHRYYFKEIMQLEDEQKSWYSKIDLNIEHGKTDKPIRPVLRVGIPVFVKNKKVGILIINIFMKYIIKDISNLSLYNIYLVDKDGDFLLHPQEQCNWSKYLNSKCSIKEYFEDSYEKILKNDVYTGEKVYSKLLDLDNGENIKMILEPRFYKTQEHIQEHIDEMIFIMLFIVLLSIPVAYVFSSKFSRLKEKVDRLNSSLEQKIQIKTKKLQRWNERLEQRVKEEVDKNREKEKQILFQGRLAQMGEMISMIAHQWRQPLSAISATVGVMKYDVIMDEYKKETFEKSLNSISNYSQHLSATIEDFRNFFKDDKAKEETTIEDIVESSLSIIGSTLIAKNIELIKEYRCNETLIIYKNELKQVVLNIIKNAEDALLERNIEKPSIHIKSYKQEKNRYILEISDNAGGIPKDIMEKIFVPYFSTKKNRDGTGLGLYMSKMIIEDHCNGKLSVSNNGEGALFTIELKSID